MGERAPEAGREAWHQSRRHARGWWACVLVITLWQGCGRRSKGVCTSWAVPQDSQQPQK